MFSWVGGSYVKCMFICIGNCQTALRIHQQWMRVRALWVTSQSKRCKGVWEGLRVVQGPSPLAGP